MKNTPTPAVTSTPAGNIQELAIDAEPTEITQPDECIMTPDPDEHEVVAEEANSIDQPESIDKTDDRLLDLIARVEAAIERLNELKATTQTSPSTSTYGNLVNDYTPADTPDFLADRRHGFWE